MNALDALLTEAKTAAAAGDVRAWSRAVRKIVFHTQSRVPVKIVVGQPLLDALRADLLARCPHLGTDAVPDPEGLMSFRGIPVVPGEALDVVYA